MGTGRTFTGLKAAEHIERILTLTAEAPRTAVELCELLGLSKYSMSLYLGHLRGVGENPARRQLKISGFREGPRGSRIPLYSRDSGPDVRPSGFVSRTKPAKQPKLAYTDDEFFLARKQELARRIKPPAWSADPMLAWIPARTQPAFREAA